MIADECVGEDSLSIRFHAFIFYSIYTFAPYIMISSTSNHVSKENRIYNPIRIYGITTGLGFFIFGQIRFRILLDRFS